MPSRRIPAPGAEEENLQEEKHTIVHLIARVRIICSHPEEQQQRNWDHKELQTLRLLNVAPEGLLVNLIPTRGEAGRWWPVGAHVIEVSRELHLPGLLAERLPDDRGLLRTASHGHISTVMELIP